MQKKNRSLSACRGGVLPHVRPHMLIRNALPPRRASAAQVELACWYYISTRQRPNQTERRIARFPPNCLRCCLRASATQPMLVPNWSAQKPSYLYKGKMYQRGLARLAGSKTRETTSPEDLDSVYQGQEQKKRATLHHTTPPSTLSLSLPLRLGAHSQKSTSKTSYHLRQLLAARTSGTQLLEAPLSG